MTTPPDDDDAPINEIRAIRARIWDKCGRDMNRYLDSLTKLREKYRDRLLPPPDEPADHRAA